jgi:hypothetical protein
MIKTSPPGIAARAPVEHASSPPNITRRRPFLRVLEACYGFPPHILHFDSEEHLMAKINLTAMSVEALLQLRENVSRFLTRKAGELRRDLAALKTSTADVASVGAEPAP